VRIVTKLIRAVPKALGAIAVLLLGPVVGALIGLILALLAVAQDPHFAPHAGHAAGDGLLIIMYVALSLVISIPLSIFGAGLLLFARNGSMQGQ
jgi:hypothetical protein